MLTITGNSWTAMAVNTRLSKGMCPIYMAKEEYTSTVPYKVVVGALPWYSVI